MVHPVSILFPYVLYITNDYIYSKVCEERPDSSVIKCWQFSDSQYDHHVLYRWSPLCGHLPWLSYICETDIARSVAVQTFVPCTKKERCHFSANSLSIICWQHRFPARVNCLYLHFGTGDVWLSPFERLIPLCFMLVDWI